MKILVTGAAGFIGAAVARRLLERGDDVVGLDNINTYYDVALKYGRLGELGIGRDDVDWYRFVKSVVYPGFSFVRMNLEDRDAMRMLFANGVFDAVVNLGAGRRALLYREPAGLYREQCRRVHKCARGMSSHRGETFGLCQFVERLRA